MGGTVFQLKTYEDIPMLVFNLSVEYDRSLYIFGFPLPLLIGRPIRNNFL